ncbi:benzoate 4-monooxygenase cytochrome P450 [Aspergillus unguis]
MIRLAYFHPLSAYPGPKLAAALPIPYLYAILSGRLSYYCHDLHKKYGDVVRISPNQLSYVTADAWKDIYERRPGHALLEKEPNFYQHPPNGVPGIVTVNHTEHPRIRRPFSHAFSEKALRDQQPLIRQYVDLLIGRLDEKANSGSAINIVTYYNWTTFDITGDLVFGESFGCLEKGNDHPWVEMLFGTIKLMAYFSVANAIPGLASAVQFFLGNRLKEEGRKHMEFASQKVRRRLERETDREDFMTRVLEYNSQKAPGKGFKGMTPQELDSTANHIIVAGAETTATLLSGATYFLLKNPRALEKLNKEVREAFESEDQINYLTVNELPYLRGSLEEALRLYPPVVAGLLRVTPADGEVITGQYVPGNTIVSVNHWATYHNEKNFRDPFDFVPERWLGDPRYEGDNKKAMNPFSIGPRNCLGKSLATAEMRLILARIVYNFDLELMSDSREWATDQEHYWIWQKPELHVKLHPVGDRKA